MCRLSLGVESRGYSPAVVHRLLIVVASLVVEHVHFYGCGIQTYLPCSMWNLPGLGIEPTSPALAGGVLTAGPPEKFP